jgi:hypothetical protein
MKLRKLTDQGRDIYLGWLARRTIGEMPPTDLLEGQDYTELVEEIEIDPAKQFSTRFEFGKYALAALTTLPATELLNQRNDGLWDWLTIVYFSQFGVKVSKPWHYSVTRKGHSGSLAYRHLARTAFEMYWRHGEASVVMLNVDMATWGDLSEQLTSRQNVAYHRGYILAANALYVANGKLQRGAASRVRPVSKRKPGDKVGRGSVARLAIAVRRLCLTFDTHVLGTEEMLQLLPREFAIFMKRLSGDAR